MYTKEYFISYHVAGTFDSDKLEVVVVVISHIASNLTITKKNV